MSESATFATARRERAAPATTGSRSAPRPSVHEAILKPAPPRHATTGANAKRRPPQSPTTGALLKPRPPQPPTTGTLLKPRPPQSPTTGTLLKPRPPQRDQTRLKTWFHGQQGWRRFRPHQSQAQQGRYGLHREHPPTTRAARLQPAPPLRTAAGANTKPRPPQSPNARTFTTSTPPLLAHNRPQHRLAGSRGRGFPAPAITSGAVFPEWIYQIHPLGRRRRGTHNQLNDRDSFSFDRHFTFLPYRGMCACR